MIQDDKVEKQKKSLQALWSVVHTKLTPELSHAIRLPEDYEGLDEKELTRLLVTIQSVLSILNESGRNSLSPIEPCSNDELLQHVDHGGLCLDCQGQVHHIPRTQRVEGLLQAQYDKMMAAVKEMLGSTERKSKSALAGLQPNANFFGGRMIGVLYCREPENGTPHILYGMSGANLTVDTDTIQWAPMIPMERESFGNLKDKSHDYWEFDESVYKANTFCQCAAPKMIIAALDNGWVPLEMAEMWINSDNEDLTSGSFYESCDVCKGFLGTLLCGLRQARASLQEKGLLQ